MAAQLAELVKAQGWPVQIVDEPSLHLYRNEAYKSEQRSRLLMA